MRNRWRVIIQAGSVILQVDEVRNMSGLRTWSWGETCLAPPERVEHGDVQPPKISFVSRGDDQLVQPEAPHPCPIHRIAAERGCCYYRIGNEVVSR
jgi:hypothetical protein